MLLGIETRLIAAGPIMGALAGLGAGAAVGGLVGALVGMGIPEYEVNAKSKASESSMRLDEQFLTGDKVALVPPCSDAYY